MSLQSCDQISQVTQVVDLYFQHVAANNFSQILHICYVILTVLSTVSQYTLIDLKGSQSLPEVERKA